MYKSRLLRTDSATTVGLMSALGVYLIYNNALPSLTDVRSAEPHDGDVEVARRHAAYKSAILIGAVFFVARDINSYIISGAALVGMDYLYKHSNATNPMTGKLAADPNENISSVHPLPDYEEVA